LKLNEFLKIKNFISQNVAKKLRSKNAEYICPLKSSIQHESKPIPRQARNGPT
jgi:hypothetical protein